MQQIDVTVPDAVIESVKQVLNATTDCPEPINISKALFRMKKGEYDDNVMFIKEKITNVESYPRNLPVEALVKCFQIVFQASRIAIPNTSQLNAHFITHKILDMMHRDDLLKHFPFCKSIEKQKCLEAKWSRILKVCQDDLQKCIEQS
jgi:hypothetical protein